jgi:hypothetical protein
MKSVLSRVAVCAALSVTATTAILPLTSGTALAVPVSTQTQFYANDTDGDGAHGLFSRLTPTGAPKTIVTDTGSVDVIWVTASRDGSRFADVEDTLDADGFTVSQNLVVRDVSGRLVRTIEHVSYASYHDSQPALSPNGSTLVWTRHDMVHNTYSLRRAAVASGGSVQIVAGSYGNSVFLDATTLLIESYSNPWYTVAVTGGTPVAATGFPDLAVLPTVSVDGSQVAWWLDTTAAGATVSTSSIQVATLTPTSGHWAATSPATVASGLENEHAAFSRDGSTVYYVKNDGDFGPGAIYSVASTGGTATKLDTTPVSDVWTQAIGAVDDGTPPGATTPKPAILNGTSATLGWTSPTDTDLSGTYITRTLNGGSPKNIYVPAPLTSYVDTGLTLGATYSYAFKALDRSGHSGAIASRSLTALKAAPTVADPTSTTSTKASFPVTFGPTGPSSAKFYVDYVPAGSTTWKHWVTGATGRARTFGSAAATNVAATTSTLGLSYTFKVQVKDAYGNATPSVNSSRAVVPFDQTRATLSGGSNVYGTSAFLGSIRKLWHTSDYARVTLTGNRLQVVGIKCTSCGKFAIYDGSTLIATVDTYATSSKVRQVLYTRYYSAIGTHTFTIRPKATAGRPNVMLDGFAMRR